MKRSLLLLAFLTVVPSVHASNTNPFSNFANTAAPQYLKPFARDLGGILGAATVDTGRTYGFPGFWVGADVAVQAKPDRDDQILRGANVHAFGLPMIQAGVGLPFGVDLIAHGVGAYGATIFGGGVRKSLYRTDMVDFFLPNVSVSAFGDKVNAGAFNASHGAFNATAMWNLPIVKPFVEAGYDVTRVKVSASSIPGFAGTSATANGSRFAGGVDLTPLPFFDLRLAALDMHGIFGGQLGLGVTF